MGWSACGIQRAGRRMALPITLYGASGLAGATAGCGAMRTVAVVAAEAVALT